MPTDGQGAQGVAVVGLPACDEPGPLGLLLRQLEEVLSRDLQCGLDRLGSCFSQKRVNNVGVTGDTSLSKISCNMNGPAAGEC